jgi:hypothetical protein
MWRRRAASAIERWKERVGGRGGEKVWREGEGELARSFWAWRV